MSCLPFLALGHLNLAAQTYPPRQFEWQYTFEPVKWQQWRLWTQLTPSLWAEVYPYNHHFFFVTNSSVTVDGNHGQIVESDNKDIDVFIPDVGATGNNPDWIRQTTPGGTAWSYLGEIDNKPYVTPPRQFTWNYTFDPPGQQERTWTEVGPSVWAEVYHNSNVHHFFDWKILATIVDGNRGQLVESDNKDIDVFIPNPDASGTNHDWLQQSNPDGSNWSLLGQITYKQVQPNQPIAPPAVAQAHPAAPPAPAPIPHAPPPPPPHINNCSIPAHLMACGTLLAPQQYPGASTRCIQGWHGVCVYETCTASQFTFPRVYCAPGP
jgi:hypothetical protein